MFVHSEPPKSPMGLFASIGLPLVSARCVICKTSPRPSFHVCVCPSPIPSMPPPPMMSTFGRIRTSVSSSAATIWMVGAPGYGFQVLTAM